ncbi:MAG: hypothetical protein U5N86_07755 [Planctomycetota bacterium]|nr:hypothetical protein [Planctomycetota bacterium]
MAFAREETSSAINYLHEAIRWQPATDYVYFRALLGVIDPGLTVGDEEQLVSQISAPFEENSFRLIKTAVEKDAGGVRAVIEQMKTLERDDMQWLVEYLAKAVEGERVYSRPPMRDLRKRTLFSFYVALVYHATGKKDAARSLLRSVVGSYDYLSPSTTWPRCSCTGCKSADSPLPCLPLQMS